MSGNFRGPRERRRHPRRPRNLIAMSELRHDPLSGHDVIVAAGRAARPVTFTARADERRAEAPDCPFCPGEEARTPPEVARTGTGAPDTPGWRIRVFPNLFPIVETHEVIALSPAHGRSLARLDDDEVVELFTVMRDRVRAHLLAGHAYAVAIVNHLRPAGASIEHPHAQVFALDVGADRRLGPRRPVPGCRPRPAGRRRRAG